jgi:hypothetical protein
MSQKNTIFEMIKRYELDPFNFEWKETQSVHKSNNGLIVSRLEYKNTPYFFQYDFVKGNPYQLFSPGSDVLTTAEFGGTWVYAINYTNQWLNNLKKELNEPDLWNEIQKYSIGYEDQIDNDPFSIEQFYRIQTGLNEIRKYLIENYGNSEENSKLINSKLDYLLDSAKRQGKQDWINTLIGVVVTISAALTLSPDRATTLWTLVKTAVLGIIRLLGN